MMAVAARLLSRAKGRARSRYARPPLDRRSILHDQEQIGPEQHQMHRALNDVGTAAREGDDGNGERQKQHHQVGMLDAEDKVMAGETGHQDHRRHREADGREHGAQEDIDGALDLVLGGGADRANRLGRCHRKSAQW